MMPCPVAKHCRACSDLIPHWSTDASIARRTYNARSETVASKPSFRDAWKNARGIPLAPKPMHEAMDFPRMVARGFDVAIAPAKRSFDRLNGSGRCHGKSGNLWS